MVGLVVEVVVVGLVVEVVEVVGGAGWSHGTGEEGNSVIEKTEGEYFKEEGGQGSEGGELGEMGERGRGRVSGVTHT